MSTDTPYEEIFFTGKITLKIFSEIIHKFVNEHDEANLKILQNFDRAIFDITYTEVKELVALSISLLEKYSFVKTASVVQTHNENAMNMLYGAMMNHEFFQQKNFTDKEKAIKWLLE